jgi:maleylacetoacetate isomerase
MKLYSYFRSSAAYRVRVALNLKKVDYELIPVDLVKGQHRSAEYRSINPEGLVPTLELDSGERLTQSPAILEWLEDAFPQPSLYPRDPLQRAHVRATCMVIGCDIHPINNLRVLTYLNQNLRVSDQKRTAWYHHWIKLGFASIEATVKGPFVNGGEPSMADAYLVPQVFNADRFSFDMAEFPRIRAVYEHCQTHPAFRAAHPNEQPDRRI